MQKCIKLCLFTGNIRKTPFSILIATQREMHQSKKLNIYTLFSPFTERTHQREHFKMCHLDMAAGLTYSVELSIFC